MARTTLAAATNFAHLMGIGRGSAAKPKSEDDERKKRDDETEEEYRDRMDKLDREKEGKGKAAGSKPKAQDEDEEMEEIDEARKRREDESDEDYSDRMKELDEAEAKKAGNGKADGDDSSDESDEKDAKASAARRRERARCAAIFSTTAAAKRPDMAAYFAFGTTLTRSAAVNALKAVAQGERRDAPPPQAPAPQAQRRGMQTPPNPDLGPDAGSKPNTGPSAFAAAVLQADKIRRGEA